MDRAGAGVTACASCALPAVARKISPSAGFWKPISSCIRKPRPTTAATPSATVLFRYEASYKALPWLRFAGLVRRALRHA